jgi:hypothetical protein
MIKHRIASFGAAFLLGAAVPAVAQVETQQDNTAYGGAAAEFLLLGATARGNALGGAFAALTTDVAALYYNPAGIAQLARPGVAVSSYDYLVDTRYIWAGIAYPMGGGTRSVGLSIGSFGFGDQPVYTLENPDGDGRVYSVNQTFIAATYAQNFSDRFSAGVSAKFITDRLAATEASGFAVDFGTNFHATAGGRPIRASFVIQNLGTNLRHTGAGLDASVLREPPFGTVDIPQEDQPARLRSTAWTIPVMFRVGVALDVISQSTNRLTILSEFTQPTHTKPGAGFGFEWMGANLGGSSFTLAARGSYTVNPDNDVSDLNFGSIPSAQSSGAFTSDGLALGGGLAYAGRGLRFGLDYAWRDFGLLGSTNFFTITLGW